VSAVVLVGWCLVKGFLDEVLRVYGKRVLFSRHALNQMNLSERMILRREVYEAIESDEVVEDYVDDPRGHSCLLLGRSRDGRVLHLVCAPKRDYLAVVTVYAPSLLDWDRDFRTRRRR
jgi:hypothetical protein